VPASGLAVTDSILVEFDSSLGIDIPAEPLCNALTSFNSDPLCQKISDTQISVSCNSIKTSQPIYSFGINGVTNPYAAVSLTTEISVKTFAGPVLKDASNSVLVTIVPNKLAASMGSLTSASPTVGEYAPLTATLTLANEMPLDGKIMVVFPKWDEVSLGATFITPMVYANTVTECSLAFNTPKCSV